MKKASLRKALKNALLIGALMLCSNATWAQSEIFGTVKDVTGEPLIGVSVMEVGTNNGTVTDSNGNYTLNVKPKAKLKISYVGFATQEFTAGSGKSVVLKEDNKMLNEVVVVGYGTQKKVNLTGAVSVATGNELSKRPVANSAVLLQGAIPGLRVNQGTGQPGAENVSMRLRGQGTFSSAGSDPMVLINGVQGSLENLDPNTIESISVLKDAASSAIYGARAANGVILVTTKQGSEVEGKINITYNGNIGFHSASRLYDLVTNSVDYMNYANLAWANSGTGKSYSQDIIEEYKKGNGSVEYPNFNWLDYMFRTVTVQNHNLSIAGTTGKTNYNISLNYLDQPGTLRGFNYKKYNATINLSSQINKYIKIGTYTNFMYGNRTQPRQDQTDVIVSTMSQAPTYMPWLPEDGTGITRWSYSAYDFEDRNKNMPAILANDVMSKYNDFDINSQMWLQINIFPNLTWYTKGAVRLQDGKNKTFVSGLFPVYNYHTGEQSANLDTGSIGLWVNDSRRLYTNIHSYLQYDLSLLRNMHNFSAMLGYNQEREKYESLSGYRKEFAFPLPVLDAGSNSNWSNGGTEENWAIESYFGRLTYNYKECYLFEADGRFDGTSRISKKHRWGFFPSISAAWRVTEENFIKKMNLEWLNNFKFRVSYGELGNQNIGLYPYQAIINSVSDYPYTKTSDGTVNGYAQKAYANENIKWETTSIFDLGFDITSFNGLNVTFDWYNKTTKDILRGSQVSALLGLSAPIINNGTVRNTGVELSINYTHTIKNGMMRGLNYSLGGNITHNSNKLIKFGAEEIGDRTILREGLPYGSYYMLDCIGIFADEEEVKKSPKQFNDHTLPGDLKYRDANGDGIIDNKDRVVMGGAFPKCEYAFTGSASWKNFDLSFIAQGVANKKYYTTDWGVQPFRQGSAPTKDYVENMWTPENPNNAKYPRLYWSDLGGSKNNRSNSFFLKDASFLRLKNVTVGYNLPNTLLDKAKISKLRLYISVDNILTLTPYKGLDPERSGDGYDPTYPQNRIISFGINIGF